MKKGFIKIVSALLACLVLVSTLSFTVEKHYCGRFLVDVAVFSKAKDCGMELSTHATNEHIEVKKKSCCKDEVLLLPGQDELTTSFDTIDLPQKDISFLSFYSYQYPVFKEKEKYILHKEYVPPERVIDLLVLYENFLI